jgi:hypothetical protein
MKPFGVTISQIIYLEFFIDRPTSEAFVQTKVLLFPPETLKIHIFSGCLFRNPSFVRSSIDSRGHASTIAHLVDFRSAQKM